MSHELAVYAAHEKFSKGRQTPESHPGYRSEFQRDRDRIIHCTAFRRLEYKTQVFVNHEGDLFRTRLTHTIEVAQIARSIARALGLNEDLTEAIALAHDLGHTPFGHAGQDALNHCMRDYGGFEHNLQSLRVVDRLEQKYAEFEGLNLTFETREGILKHCAVQKAKELGELGLRFIHQHQPSLEAQLANLADEIAYNNHDVDDGLRAGLLNFEALVEVKLFRDQYELVKQLYPELPKRRTTHEIVRRMINVLVNDLINSSRQALTEANPQNSDDARQHQDALIRFSAPMRQQNLELKSFLRHNLYTHYRVHRMTKKAAQVVQGLFTAFFDDSQLLPNEHHEKTRVAEKELGPSGKARIIADYIAGMTDRYAITEYKRLYEPLQLT
ncbi:MAG: deoxyguanosinetriphosphate triphosphohydrolase [Gammaproteobacteria bacterium]|nr:deoxyguanosinetriphosphate triphosphohydrolase [Gammaproteobacteria bacterium]MDH5729174.1 deoxyguanosinetriphosphate triphosphohydrolase [Gammaproteobacteria bacterium]